MEWATVSVFAVLTVISTAMSIRAHRRARVRVRHA